MLNSKTMLARRARKKVLAFSLQPSALACAGFTLVEIAICLAIIGFALLAIIGTLPRGLEIQRANREQTVINQDATVFLQAIRDGSRGLNDLTNYVFAITNYWGRYYNGKWTPGINGYTYAAASAPYYYSRFSEPITNGANIIGLMSTPEFVDDNGHAIPSLSYSSPSYSNHIVAYVYSINGPAVEKPPQANNSLVRQDSFAYRILCVNAPVPMDTNLFGLDPGDPRRIYAEQLSANLRDLRLTFLWPQLPNGALGPGRQTFRTLVAGPLVMTNNVTLQPLYFYHPQVFTNAP